MESPRRICGGVRRIVVTEEQRYGPCWICDNDDKWRWKSMNIDDRRPTTDLRAHSHILGKFQMAITLQRVNWSPSCLVLELGFRGQPIERRHCRLDQIQDGGRRRSWLTSKCHISAMHYPIHCMYPTGKMTLANVNITFTSSLYHWFTVGLLKVQGVI